METKFPLGKEHIKEYYDTGYDLKFAIISDTAKRIRILLIFPGNEYHKTVVQKTLNGEKSLKLIGAGLINKENAKWISKTCLESYGYYKPRKQKIAEKTLFRIREETQKAIDLIEL